MNRAQRYIGITDFTDVSEVRDTLNHFEKVAPKDTLLHVGVMTSRKVLEGETTKWADVFPKPEKISGIFFKHERLLNTIHYADYDSLRIEANLRKVIEVGGKALDAVQLDMVWPNPIAIKNIKKNYPHIKLILQINAAAMHEEDDKPSSVVRRLREYDNHFSYFLLDKSMGRGLGLDAKSLKPFIYPLLKSYPYAGVVIAGGLGPDTCSLAYPVLKDNGCVSVDAQSRLRRSANAMDQIDWDMAKDYLTNMSQLYKNI